MFCEITTRALAIEALTTIGKQKLKDVLKLSEATLQKDSIFAFGTYENTYLIRKLGKGFTNAATNQGFIEADTKRFNTRLTWLPTVGDSTSTNIYFKYIKK